MEIQILDVDYTLVGEKPIVRIFGKTEEGKTICAFYENYLPYMYADYNNGVEEILKDDPQVVKIEVVKKIPVNGFQQAKDFYKITLRNPSKTPEIRERLKANGINTYEADILFKYRFMNDFGIGGMSWIKIDTNGAQTNTVRADQCVKIKNIESVKKNVDSPLRFMSVDIECVPEGDRALPEPEKDPIIMIALAFDPPFKGRSNLVLTTRPGTNVLAFETEKEMLENFLKIVDEYDPDVITGYNINNFDLPYLLGRMKQNEIKPLLGRCKQKPTVARKVMNRYKISMTGRVVVDSYEVVKRDFSFTRYGLDFVAEKLLGKKKHDVRHSEIRKLWQGEQGGFERLVEYCRMDAILAIELIVKLNLIDKYVALSKVAGTLLQDTLDSGETTRIENFLLREFNKEGFILPCKPDAAEIQRRDQARKSELKGGYVLEPKKGLHTYVAVFDFKSMYPSIIRTFNICPSTLIKDGEDLKDVIKTPLGTVFASKDVRHGVVPRILENLMNQRQEVKKELKQTKDKEKRRILDAEQWALKIMSNAFYGYLGYIRARIYNLDIANTITYTGRYIIKKTKKMLEDLGYTVVYGDTDSVFVKMDCEDMNEIREKCMKISQDVTEKLPGVLELEFEKVFKRFLPLTKKRYIAWSFEPTNDGWEEKIEMKGVETVRRDWCDLVSDTMRGIIEILMKKNDTKAAVNYFKNVVNDLLNNKVDVQKLVITKTMTKQAKSYAGMQPHIELVKKLQMRNPADVPGIGDRIGYVIVKGTGLLSKRAEDPEYVKEKGLEIDSQYYIENQLMPPLERIFNALGVSKSELLGNGKQVFLWDIINNNEKDETKVVCIEDILGFVCENCSKYYTTPPLIGRCSCGGKIMFSSPQGTVDHVCVDLHEK